MSSIINIDVYYLENSAVLEKLKALNNSDINFNFINQNDFDKKNNNNCKVIIFEENSYLTSLERYQNIISNYKASPVSIILSNNKEVFNVVKWMREGGVYDYLLKNELTKEIVANSIKSSIDYIDNYNNKIVKTKNNDQTKIPFIKIPDKVNWSSLENNNNYDLAIVMFEVIIKNESRYSKSFIENIHNQIKMESDRISSIYGGKLWFWSNNFGATVFHFGDFVDCSILSAIHFYNNFFLFCIERLSLKEILDFKIVINEGNCIFNNTNTDHITSDVINTLTHITRKFTKTNCLNINESVFKKMSPKFKPHFFEIEKFQKNKIYQYNFFNY